jgi:hypothetical protein
MTSMEHHVSAYTFATGHTGRVDWASIKESQRNWIGKVCRTMVDFFIFCHFLKEREWGLEILMLV